ncbi:rhodanese-like domain-containing protein [candidate division KSB1 bacterium]|nr:MAG: rhodanese-like domain-containing protein [candidate division KSB1 bacterium]MBC6950998.1 rhodanese-like domain-containing protein [candidate division KSB1 bacterium]MCE7941799.1 rhodanese-like domain-containing protein [Chlorobi bacterium CHB1]MDL1876848.1 rhodanese-like domain-containing protein [Cytophagia bacterium CHB2]
MSIKIIIGIVTIALLAIIIARQFVLGKKIRHYQADEVAEKLRSASPPVLLDVRTMGEFRRGHIVGALHIPVQELGRRWQELEEFRAREIVVYCATGPRSVNAVNILQKRGFNAVNLRGGMKAWQAIQNE